MIQNNPTKELKDVKAEKITALKTALDDVCKAGYEYEGNIFNLSAGSMGEIDRKLRLSINTDNRYKFFTKGDNRKAINFVDDAGFNAFASAILKRKDWIMFHYNQLYGSIENANSPQEVNDIVIDFAQV